MNYKGGATLWSHNSFMEIDPLPQLKGSKSEYVQVPMGPSASKVTRPSWLFVYVLLVPYKRKLRKGIKISPGKFVLFQKIQR